ncbi:MAG: sulfatase [Planctomycetota bacterium]
MLVDDLRPLLGCYGRSAAKTPNLDRLAASGVTFERQIAQQPICMASRASLMTGRCPDRDRIYSCEPLCDLVPDALTLNRHAAAHGYATPAAGKVYHFSRDNTDQFGAGYAEPAHRAIGRGYVNPEARDAIEANSEHRQSQGYPPETLITGRGNCTEVGECDERDYADGAMSVWAVDQVRHHAGTNDPFMLTLGWRKPHLPFAAPKPYWDLYSPDDFEFPEPDRIPRAAAKLSRYTFNELRNYLDVPDGEAPIDDALARRLIHGYHAAVSFVDAQIGRVLDALDETGLAENTVVVLAVDHGFQLREHGLWCKHTCFRESYHVPCIVRAPGVTPAGGRVRGLSENLDLFPTICDLAGLPIPGDLDGQSRVGWLRDPYSGGSPAVFTLWPVRHRQDPDAAIIGYTVLTDAFRYTEWTRRARGEVLEAELFDLAADPAETVNVVAEPSYQTARDELSGRLAGRYPRD